MKHNYLKTAGAFTAIALAIANLGLAQTTVQTTTTSAGTISEFSPDTIVIKSETAPAPIRYTYTKSTTYVDDTGAPVSLEVVKSGLPVTVHYIREGDRVIANRVIVHKRTTTTTTEAPAPAPAPVIEEKKTTTTTTTREK